jgi:arsenite-transporting ATPase
MSIEEAADGIAALATAGMAVSEVIVNRVTSPPDRSCAWCDSRRSFEAQTIESARRRLPQIRLIRLAARDVEPRGVRALGGIGAEIRKTVEPEPQNRRLRKSTWTPSPPQHDGVVTIAGIDRLRLLLFGGKGGVGKTTCAAAAALEIARRHRNRRVLLLSVDPAHSLGDVLGTPVSDVPSCIPGGPSNLQVREMDAQKAFRDVRDRYAAAIDTWFDRLSRGGSGSVTVDAGHDRRVMHGLMELAPPGIDELTAVLDAMGGHSGVPKLVQGDDELVVMDTAPSGHALRLLEMPALVQDWARALMSLLLKYQPVAGIGELGAVLLRMSQGLGSLRALLADNERTAFVPVTRAAALPRAETCRLLVQLAGMSVHVPLVVVNVVGRGTCRRCRAQATHELRELAGIGRLAGGPSRTRLPVVVAPAQIPPPHGAEALIEWRGTWRRSPNGR